MRLEALLEYGESSIGRLAQLLGVPRFGHHMSLGVGPVEA